MYARAVTKAAIRATLDLTPSHALMYTDPLIPTTPAEDSDLVLDFRASLLLRHLRHPPPAPPEDAPLPNGASVVEGLRVLLQAQRVLSRAQQEARQTPPAGGVGGGSVQEDMRDRRLPGGMDPPEDGEG
jgi:hypothetical protein